MASNTHRAERSWDAPGGTALDVQLDRAATTLADSITAAPYGPRISALAVILLVALSPLFSACAPVGESGQDARAAISDDIAAARNLGRPSSLSPGETASEQASQAYPWVGD